MHTSRLSDIARIDRASLSSEKIQDGTLYLGLENIESGGNIIKVQTVENGELKSSKFCFTPEHILYGKLRPYLAKITAPDFHGICSTDIIPVLPGPKVDRRYLLHFLRQDSMVEFATSRSSGANLPRLSPKELANFQIPLPPLAEQKRIAAILDAADELRAKRREAIAQLDVFLQSTFIEMFGDPVTNPKGWPVVNFEDAVYFQEGPGIRKWQFRNKGIKLVNIRNIVDGELVLTNTEKYLDPDEVSRTYSHFLLDAGDLVMSSSGVTWGKIAYVKQQHLPLSLNTSMIRLRPQGGRITHAFIRAFVESQAFRRQISRLITGSAQPNFGPSHLRKIVINLPPIDIQSHFEEIVASIEHQKSLLNVHLAELDTLFASLQHRAFNGEL